MQPKCKFDDREYCIRPECVGPCETVEEIHLSDEEFQRIVDYVNPAGKTLN